MAELGDFKSWCLIQGLDDTTIRLLQDKGITNLDTLRLITPALLDTELKVKNLGQHLLLKEAICKLWITSSRGGTSGAPIGGSIGQSSDDSPPAYNTLALAFNTPKIANIAPETAEVVPSETFNTSKNTQLPPLHGGHPPISSSHNQSQGHQLSYKQKQPTWLRKKPIPKPKNAAKAVHAAIPLNERIAVATEQHPEKHPKAHKAVEEEVTASTHGAEFVRTHSTLDDKIAVATEHHPGKLFKKQKTVEEIPASTHGAEFVHTHSTIDDKIAVANEHHPQKHLKKQKTVEEVPTSTHGAEFVHTHSTTDDKIAVATEHHPQKHPKSHRTVEEEVSASMHGADFVHTHSTINDKIAVATEHHRQKHEPAEEQTHATTHGAEFVRSHSTLDDKIAIATELHLKKFQKSASQPVIEEVSTHGAEFVHSHSTIEDRITVATEQHPQKQPKKKAPVSYNDLYIKHSLMFDLIWLSFWFSFALFGTSIAGAIYQTSIWKYFNGAWAFVFVTSALFCECKMKDNARTGKKSIETCFKVMSILVHLGLVACLPMMGIAVYGMYIDREIHIYGKSCDNELIVRLKLTCEYNDTIGMTYAYTVGWNPRQGIHIANIVLGYVVFIILLWVLYIRNDFIKGRPPITFENNLEKGFLGTSFIFQLTPITFPIFSAIGAIFNIAMWEFFLPAICGVFLLITGFHAHNLYFLPDGAKKMKRYKVQYVLLIVSMIFSIAMVICHILGIYIDNEIHEFGVSCEEDYIRYFNFTCESENIEDDPRYRRHAYLTRNEINYKQWIHICNLTLGILHLFCLFHAVDSGKAFLKKCNKNLSIIETIDNPDQSEAVL